MSHLQAVDGPARGTGGIRKIRHPEFHRTDPKSGSGKNLPRVLADRDDAAR
jgi:hypothetical protein